MDPTGNDCRIIPVPLHARPAALELLFAHLASEDRQRQIAALSGSPEGLWGAYRAERLVGAVLGQTQPGRCANVWTPRLANGESPATATQLLKTLCQGLFEQGIHLAQGLLATTDAADEAVLRAGGFAWLADLLYLVSLDTDFPTAEPHGPVEFEPYAPANQSRLTQIVEATYRQTLDCPKMNGVRRMEDVLEGYRATGAFDPARWLLVRHAGRDVGCLLLADHPREENWELVYMGVVAEARGHGWGIDIVRHAQWLARRAGRPRLVLAVDAENGPAIRMYAAAGFQAWNRRRAYVKVLSGQ